MTSNCERDSNLVPSPPGGGLYLCILWYINSFYVILKTQSMTIT